MMDVVLPGRVRAALLALLIGLAPLAAEAQTADPASRPRTGLVLSGGGARGLAHVGVLRVLEEMRIPIDVIAGTSMGAIVGGLYASGMTAAELEREVLRIQWGQVFANRVARRELSQRRKEEDFEISTAIELGLRDGELVAPQGAVSSRGLETLLRRFTLPVRGVQRFDQLPTPFRAVATDMETGQPVIFDHGDLALALRSSMSVPGVFSPTDVDGRILGDGGLVNNLPVDVARAMGVDRLIVINIGTPLAPRDTLVSAVGLTAQMINILTEQNVQRSLAQLTKDDLLLTPDLGRLTASDFEQGPAFIRIGHDTARAAAPALARFALDAPAYGAWQAQRARLAPPDPTLAFVRIEGSEHTNPERLQSTLETAVGQRFDPRRAERDTRRLAAGGDYVRADYQIVTTPEGDGLVFELEDKPWGPNYLRLGLDLSTDFSGRSAFNLKLSHNRHWLTPNGTEWRNRVQIGAVPLLYSELYHPLNWTSTLANDWFVSGYGSVERRRQQRFEADGGELQAEFKRTTGGFGLDIGQPWGEIGELRLGLSYVSVRTSPQLLGATYLGPAGVQTWNERGLRARVVVDQLDFANFPLSGYRFEGVAWAGERRGDIAGRFGRLEAQGSWVRSWGTHTLNLHGRLALSGTSSSTEPNVGRYTLGGFHQLSGYQAGQLEGNDLLLLRLGWYQRLTKTPTLTRGFFVGGTLEAGNVWNRRGQLGLGDLRTGMSLYLGADTGIGPLYLGFTYAPRGAPGLALFIGRP